MSLFQRNSTVFRSRPNVSASVWSISDTFGINRVDVVVCSTQSRRRIETLQTKKLAITPRARSEHCNGCDIMAKIHRNHIFQSSVFAFAVGLLDPEKSTVIAVPHAETKSMNKQCWRAVIQRNARVGGRGRCMPIMFIFSSCNGNYKK